MSIIGANTLRFSSISCFYFLSHNRLVSWVEPLVWEKIASSLGHVEKWKLSTNWCEGTIFFFLLSQWALKWETELGEALKGCENRFLTLEALVGKSWTNNTKDKQ